MSCVRSSSGVGVGDPSSGLGSSSSTCSLKSELGKGSRISDGWTKKSTGELGAATEGICALFGKRFKAEKEDREARK